MSRVSHSEADSYLSCKRKHFYGYGMSLQPVSVSTALAVGSAGHEVLEAFYLHLLASGDTNVDQMLAFSSAVERAHERYNELVAEGYEDVDTKRMPLATILFDWYFPNETLVRTGWTILAVEQEFVLEYDSENELQFPLKIDVIARDPEGKVAIIDHKFCYDFMSYEETELTPQVAKYMGALRALNHKIDYGVYNQIRTRKIIGTKSKAHPDGAGPTLAQMIDVLPIKPNSTRVQTVFLEQIGVAAEIQARKDLPFEVLDRTSFRVNSKMTCRMCNFKDLCVTQLIGGNSELMIKTEYKVRERKVFAEEPSEDAE